MENKFIKITDKNKWRDLLEKVLFKTFFHYIEWEEYLEPQFKWLKFERYIYEDKALLSMARAGNKLISHPFCEYGGPLPLVAKIDGEKFKQDLFSEFKNHIKINFHPRLASYFQDGTRSVLVASERVSYFMEGAPDLRKTTRHEIEKAKNNNIEIKKCNTKEELREFYHLHLKNAKRHKIPAYPRSFFGYFNDSRDSEIILAKKDGKTIAGSVFLFYDKFAHYFHNAGDPKYKNLGVNYLILWEQLQRYGDKVFDLGGTRVGSPLQIFKEGWGGKEYPIYELTNCGGVRLGLRGRPSLGILRNAFGILPLSLIEKLSPYLLKYKL